MRQWFDSTLGHHFEIRGSRIGRTLHLQCGRWGAVPHCSTKFILVNRPRWRGRAVNSDAAGSNPATRALRCHLLVVRKPASHAENGSSILPGTAKYGPLVEWTRRRSTKPKVEVRIFQGSPIPGCSLVWLKRLLRKQETRCSNHRTLTKFIYCHTGRISSMKRGEPPAFEGISLMGKQLALNQ